MSAGSISKAFIVLVCFAAVHPSPSAAQEAEVDIGDWGNVQKIDLWTQLTVHHRSGRIYKGRLTEVTAYSLTITSWRDKPIHRKDVVKILVNPLHFARGRLTNKTIGAELGMGFLWAFAFANIGSRYLLAGRYSRSPGGSIEDVSEFARWYAGMLIGSTIGAYIGVWQVGQRYYEIGTPEGTVAGSVIAGVISGFLVLTIPNDEIGYVLMPASCA
ncbi:hypothetical protein ACFLT7_03640, partial [candidate division KSB1 bacterium]